MEGETPEKKNPEKLPGREGLVAFLLKEFKLDSTTDALRAALIVCDENKISNPDQISGTTQLTIPEDLKDKISLDKTKREDREVWKEYRRRIITESQMEQKKLREQIKERKEEPEPEGVLVRKRVELIEDAHVYARVDDENDGVGKTYPFREGRNLFALRRHPTKTEWLDVRWNGGKGYIHESQVSIQDRGEQPKSIPSTTEISELFNTIPRRYKKRLSPRERGFVLDQAHLQLEGNEELNRDQYVIIVDRERQFAALTFYNSAANKFEIIGDGVKVSTGQNALEEKKWATPARVYNLKNTGDINGYNETPELRADGTGKNDFGPVGSRVLLMEVVDLDPPHGKSTVHIAMHKTSQKDLFGTVPASQGCVRVPDEFMDLLDNYFLMDGKFGQFIVVTDSTGKRERGDNLQKRMVAKR